MAWLWVLSALLLAVLLWWFLRNDENEASEPTGAEIERSLDSQAVSAGAGADQVRRGPITEISTLLPSIPLEMVGREVRLSGVRVLETDGDARFWIGEGSDRRIYAVLGKLNTAPRPKVNAGVTANLRGTVRTRPEALEGVPAELVTSELPSDIDRFLMVSSYEEVSEGE